MKKDLLIGTILTLPSTEIVEIVCQAGLDWLFIDLEHSALSIQDAQRMLQVAGPEIPGLIRVPSNDDVWIKRVLDIGATGIIVPQVNTAADTKRTVRFCKYPPEGSRSVGIARAQGYGDKFQDYVALANQDITVIIQIEHIDAVENIDKILAVPGIDGLFVGPYDLSASMGKTGLTTDPEVQTAIAKVKKAASQINLPMGIFGPTAKTVHPYIEAGYTLIAVGIDTMIVGKAVKEIVGVLK
ncbi:MAG: 2,4-dihydroxyhept-2-ene-1,7-dioic acid aldolase [Desulfobacterales bacterium]|nr:2,4-dihydroxyhept-2-ene-1,7-dioic acid aldolase [Desulfobacterales bacterium]